MPDWKNKLFFGDNLHVLREHVADESVDLIYLDPPFNSNANYNVLFAEANGSKSSAQITAFDDTWHWGIDVEGAYHDVVTGGPKKVSDLMQAYRQFLGTNDMMAYLTMMAPRLVELHRVLKPTGSLYLHCDPTASHYLKLLMDAIFGAGQFRNEIIWYYYNKMHDRRKKLFPRATDTLLFFVKNTNAPFTFHQLKEERDQPVRQLRRKKVDGRMVNAKDKDGHVIYNLKHDRTIDNVWRIPCLQPAARERLGYPTQKPEALLARIVQASSNDGDVVLDPFCGCGTTIAVAERLHRRWIGIDVTHLAIALMRHRLHHTFPEQTGKDKLSPYEVIGEPEDLSGACALSKQDRYQFEWWALGLVDARPAQDKKKGADSGTDGYIYFFDDASGKAKQLVLQVKSGKVGASVVRDLKGVLERENAPIGVLITLARPTRPMLTEAAAAGFYEPELFPGTQYPRLQILTIEELLAGKKPAYPMTAPATFKKAKPRAKDNQPELFTS